MKTKKLWPGIYLFVMLHSLSANATTPLHYKNHRADDYSTTVTFPAGYVIGDYIEFVRVAPIAEAASGYYEISIAYTRNGVAAAATHLTSISHYNPALWRDVGRVNSNGYADVGQNFTIDCNGETGNPRFRIRAINTLGVLTQNLIVYIKVRSININGSFVALNASGNDLSVTKLMPMTNEWDLYVGNPFTNNSASIAIKALENGNVGIGTSTPQEKLSVNGKIRAKEIKVETTNWPDYVFDRDYKLPSLEEIEKYIAINKHLPEIPTTVEVEKNGIALGETNRLLLKKIEEITLYLIELKKENKLLNGKIEKIGKKNEN